MIDFSRPVQTRNGQSVRILATDRKNPAYPVVGLRLTTRGGEEFCSWAADGRYHSLDPNSHPWDLVNVPRKRTVFLNIYEHDATIYKSESEAARAAGSNCLRVAAPVEVEY